MELCTYCGDVSECRDHVVPVSFTSNIPARKRGKTNKKDTVPCCTECNSLLGNKLLTTVETRAAYLIGVMELRYANLLETPYWSQEDLDDLGYTMRSDIENTLNHKRNIIDRLKYLNLVSMGR